MNTNSLLKAVLELKEVNILIDFIKLEIKTHNIKEDRLKLACILLDELTNNKKEIIRKIKKISEEVLK